MSLANFVYKCVYSKIYRADINCTYIAGWQRGTLICYLWFDIQVSRAFIAARALSQGLATGRDIVNKATKVSGSYSASLHAYLEWNI